MSEHDLARNVQAQTQPARVAAGAGLAVKRGEQRGAHAVGDGATAVADREPRVAVELAELDLDRRARRAVAQGVAEQVGDHLIQAIRVP